MKGLFLKDVYTLKPQLRFYIFLVIIWLLVALQNKNGTFFCGLIAILIYLIPISAISYEDRMKTTAYSLTMPYSRKDLVVEKYLLGLIVAAAGFVVSFIVDMAFSSGVVVSASSSFAIIGIGIVFLSLSLPLMFKFGFEKARIISMVFIVLPCCLVPFSTPTIIKKQSSFSESDFLVPAIIVFIVSLVLAFISMQISIKIMNKKEF